MPMSRPERVPAWKDSKGTLHPDIEDWKRVELGFLLSPMLERVSELPTGDKPDQMAAELLTQADAAIAILTTGPRSRPKARKTAGTTNPKRATKAQAKTGIRAMRDAVSIDPSSAAGTDVPAEAPAEPYKEPQTQLI